MRITEHGLLMFFYGSVVGSVITYYVTYYNLTREKRIISNVRRQLGHLELFHDLTQREYDKLQFSRDFVSDERILTFYGWAQRVTKGETSKELRKLEPTSLAAEVIICEQLLGLSASDAVQALLNCEDLDELKTLRRKGSN